VARIDARKGCSEFRIGELGFNATSLPLRALRNSADPTTRGGPVQMRPVTSTNVLEAGYDPAAQILRIRFRSGGIYDYFNIDPLLFQQMLLPYPWRRIGEEVKMHPYRRVA
jgi:hypothetical protein